MRRSWFDAIHEIDNGESRPCRGHVSAMSNFWPRDDVFKRRASCVYSGHFEGKIRDPNALFALRVYRRGIDFVAIFSYTVTLYLLYDFMNEKRAWVACPKSC